MAIYDENGVVEKIEHLTPSTQESEELKTTGPGEAALRGFSNASTLGLGKYIQAPVNAIPGMPSNDPSKSYWDNIKNLTNQEIDANAQASKDQPAAYFGGSVVGAAPMALGAGGLSPLKAAAAGGAGAGVTTLADTQDPMKALASAGIGAAIPAVVPALGAGLKSGAAKVLDKTSSLVGAPQEANKILSDKIAQLGTKRNLISKRAAEEGIITPDAKFPSQIQGGGKASTAITRGSTPAELASKVGSGSDVLNQPQWAHLKSFLSRETAPSAVNLQDILKAGGGGSAGGWVGSTLGMPGVGAAVGTVLASKDIAKKALVGRELKKALSPAAQAGTKKLEAAVKDPSSLSQGVGHGARWAGITNTLQQTDPEVRAAMNADNPLNGDQE